MKIKPRILPHDFLDCLIALAIGCVQIVALFVIPFALGTLVLNVLAGMCAVLVIYLAVYLFSVRSVTMDAAGIQFQRVLGYPKSLPWGSIVSVEEASSREVVLRGWLWPIFPSREMTPSLSSKHHFRIRWVDGFCYFPPKDVEQFKNTVSKMRNAKPRHDVIRSVEP